MKTVGEYLRELRLGEKLSLSDVEERTRIKKDFIVAIERGKWDVLPEYPVVSGFVKSIAGALNGDRGKAQAFLRRDYQLVRKENDLKLSEVKEFRWSPRLTFVVGVLAVVGLIGSYLTFQYINFMKPPALSVEVPIEGQVVRERTVFVKGKTDGGATVRVNGQPAVVDDEGNFSAEIGVTEGLGQIEVKVLSRSGKETQIIRKLKVEL